MDDTEARKLVTDAIVAVAPEAPLEELGGEDDLFSVLEIDSMDLLKIVTVIHERTAIDIPERDYGKLGTLDDFTDYLVAASDA